MTANQRKSRPLPPHMVKANLCEEIVAMLHAEPGVSVQQKVKLPSRSNPKRRREVDVLVSTQALGRTVSLAFECKNYAGRVGVEKINEFEGKLRDVGIPAQYGLMVSAYGYTSDAEDLAQHLGITLLVLEGLSADRLTSSVNAAFQSIVYLLLHVGEIRIETEIEIASEWDLLFLRDTKGKVCGSIPDLIWAQWRDEHIPSRIGEYDLSVAIPPRWHWVVKGVEIDATATATVRVIGYVITLSGEARAVALRNVQSGVIERGHIDATFDIEQTRFPVVRASTEEELEAITGRPAVANITIGRIRIPRIRHYVYWPPSERVGRMLKRHGEDSLLWGFDKVKPVSEIPIEVFEGTDMATLWEPIFAAHPSVKNPHWPWAPSTRSGGRGKEKRHRIAHNAKRRH